MTEDEREMICICSVDGKRETEAMRLEIQARLGVARPEDLLLAVGLSVTSLLGREITVDVDQWFGVGVSDGPYVECDDPIDGLLWCWRILANQHPEVTMPHGAASEEELLAVRTLSAHQLDAYSEARRIWDEHIVACSSCATKTKWSLCPVAQPLWKSRLDTGVAIRAKWGSGEWINAYCLEDAWVADD